MSKKTSTPNQRLNSIYRRQIDMDRKLDDTIRLLANHLTRVLRQNDTLREALGQKEIAKLADANAFLASPLPPRLSIGRAEALRDAVERLSPSGASGEAS